MTLSNTHDGAFFENSLLNRVLDRLRRIVGFEIGNPFNPLMPGGYKKVTNT